MRKNLLVKALEHIPHRIPSSSQQLPDYSKDLQQFQFQLQMQKGCLTRIE